MKLPRIHAERLPLLSTVIILALIYAFACWRYNNFFTAPQSVNFFRDGATTGIIAVGMTFVILSGGIDLSVGAVIGFTCILYAKLVVGHDMDIFYTIPLVLAITVAVGAGMGALIHYFKVPPFLITLAGMFMYRGAALVISTSPIGRGPGIDAIVDYTRIVLRPEDPVRSHHIHEVTLGIGVYAFLAVFAGAVVIQSVTTVGRSIYAIGGSEQSALLMGLPVARNKILIYAFSGLCAGIAGLVFMANQGGRALNGNGAELDAIAVVVIGGTLLTGGTGSVWGTLFGMLIFSLITEIVANRASTSSGMIRILIGQLLLAFILLQKLLQFRRRGATAGAAA